VSTRRPRQTPTKTAAMSPKRAVGATSARWLPSGAIGIAIRRWRRQTEATDFGQPTAAVTRWRVSALPSTPLPVPGVGRARWQLELIRCRAGESADFEVEACDAKGRLALPSGLVHGSGSEGNWAAPRRRLMKPRSS
jgi:hypothetical protein